MKSFDSEELIEGYFDYLYTRSGLDINDECKELSKRRFARKLFDTPFENYNKDMDESRSVDGMGLRYVFECSMRDGYFSELDFDEFKQNLEAAFKDKGCSIFELMLGVAERMENIMSDPAYPDRTYQWINKMIVSLGLGGIDERYIKANPDWEKKVEEACKNFCERKYDANGKGGLFFIASPKPEEIPDMRTLPIWKQMMVYCNKIT